MIEISIKYKDISIGHINERAGYSALRPMPTPNIRNSDSDQRTIGCITVKQTGIRIGFFSIIKSIQFSFRFQ